VDEPPVVERGGPHHSRASPSIPKYCYFFEIWELSGYTSRREAYDDEKKKDQVALRWHGLVGKAILKERERSKRRSAGHVEGILGKE
jgi:hypothetical protein